PVYTIKYASSTDGINWNRPNISCVAESGPEEASTRPAVVYDDGVYHMWFSYRGSRAFRGGHDSYRIGYAVSQDGRTWLRNDASAGITLSSPGNWDSQMIAYPNIIDTPSGRYLFYNGNHFGRAGFGYAVLE